LSLLASADMKQHRPHDRGRCMSAKVINMFSFSADAARALRRLAGLSRTEAASRMGLAAATVSRYEASVCRPSLDALARMADAYGCNVGDFFRPGPDDAVAPVGPAPAVSNACRAGSIAGSLQ
jgi:DNA-binding XRE family transcriptional regulator